MKTVTTKSQLKKAIKDKEEKIIITGNLAKSVYKAKKITKVGMIGIAILGASLATIPATGGLSVAAAAPIAAEVGVDSSVIIAIVAVGGLVIILGIYTFVPIYLVGKI